ncbi:MAG: acyl-ACP--UDP-N-acetylglucosamine O-acyltransferase [Puniceicoccales bacterium]|jgi:UDP-N-acetylglucosamine acyltransferase|nr:acyl-ACP--UDP-N-acetylglucosamine O-acyltransferase [Puniceicoccales bacterium]
MLDVHNLAIIGENVSLGHDVYVGPYAIVEDNVKIGRETIISSHAIVRCGTTIGERCFIDSFAVIGGLPQHETFDATIPSRVIVGNDTIIREHALIHRATSEIGFTKVGNSCILQSGSLVDHDCEVGDHSTLVNGSMLGGEVKLGQKCFIGGGAAIHQYVVVGDYVSLAGSSATALDLPPYTIAAYASTVIGLNLIRLQREKMDNKNIVALKECFHEFYKKKGNFNFRERAKAMLKSGYGTTYETSNFLNFFLRKSRRGFAPKRHKIVASASYGTA